jgi:hypothetical protein
MSKKIKQVSGLLLIIFLFVVSSTAMLFVWGFSDGEVAKETLLKITFTFVIIYIVSLLIMFVINKVVDK